MICLSKVHQLYQVFDMYLSNPAFSLTYSYISQPKVEWEYHLLKNWKCIFVAYRIKLEIPSWLLYPYCSSSNAIFSNILGLAYVISSDPNALFAYQNPASHWRILNDTTPKKPFLIKINPPQLKSTPLQPIKVVIWYSISWLVADILISPINVYTPGFQIVSFICAYATNSTCISYA